MSSCQCSLVVAHHSVALVPTTPKVPKVTHKSVCVFVYFTDLQQTEDRKKQKKAENSKQLDEYCANVLD